MSYSSEQIRAARAIENAYLAYQKCRYKGLVDNWDDKDPFLMEPVCATPRSLLFVVHAANNKRYGFHALHLMKWFCTNPTNPITREHIPVEIRKHCRDVVQLCLDQQHAKPEEIDEIECHIIKFDSVEEIRFLQAQKKIYFEHALGKNEKMIRRCIRDIRENSVIETISVKQEHDELYVKYEFCVNQLPEASLRKLVAILNRINKEMAKHFDVLNLITEDAASDVFHMDEDFDWLHTFCEVVE